MLKRTLTIQMLLICVIVLASTIAATAQFNRTKPIYQKTEILLNEAADLDQCANGPQGTPVQCTGSAWVNGNLNQNQAHYLEGESVPYRLRFTGLVIGSMNTVTIEWDTTVNTDGKHALDYLTSFDRTETDAFPCSGVTGCSPGVYTTLAIPLDPKVLAGNDEIPGTLDDIAQEPGQFYLFGGTFDSVSTYSIKGSFAAASATRITLTFRADVENPVLAWGGHISTRYDWGFDHSAIAIPGASYHMRLIELNGSGGNQDRSLANSAAVFPGRIVITKDAQPNSVLRFYFTATGPDVYNFILDDDGNPTINYPNTQLFANLTYFGSTNQVTITETPYDTWFTLADILCTSDPNGGAGTNNNVVSLEDHSVVINLEEGETVACTFVNAVTGPTAANVSIVGRVADANLIGLTNVALYLTPSAGTELYMARTNAFGYYRFDGIPSGQSYVLSIGAKGYVFEPPSILLNVQDNLEGINFVAVRDR